MTLLSSAEESSLNVSLHPLPLLNASEHLTRARLQSGNDAVRVVGSLIGTQNGRDVEITNSFEFALTDQTLDINHAFFTTRRDQFKQVFPTYEILGWYSVGSSPTEDDLYIHKQMLAYNETPMFLQLSPDSIAGNKELPVTIYESITEIIDNQPQTKFIVAPYRVETGEAERVAVDHASKSTSAGTGDSTLVTSLTTQRNALKMLQERVEIISQYVERLSKGTAPKDHETLRQVQALLGSLPTADSSEFRQEYMTEYSDVLLTSYLASMTKAIQPLSDLVDRFSLSQAQHGGGQGGKGRGPGRVGREAAPLGFS